MTISPVVGALLCLISILGTRYLTGRVRDWAMSRAVIDLPNARSLHSMPTPRGGGLAIVIVVLVIEAGLLVSGVLSAGWAWAGWLATLSLALIGIRDDLKSLSASVRLGLQFFVCTAWAIWVFGIAADLPEMLHRLATVVVMVWIVNLYNFMDGSDGLAATQATVAGLAGGLLAVALGMQELAIVALLVAASSSGFLFWNWHPAKIFLGDVGSYFLGGQFAVMGASTIADGKSSWFWVILLGPFFVDATLTLLRRVVRGERWFAAHRTHAYQLLVRAGCSQSRLALALAGLIVFLCVPLAGISVWRPELAASCVLLCYAFLGTMWWRIVRAHLSSNQDDRFA